MSGSWRLSRAVAVAAALALLASFLAWRHSAPDARAAVVASTNLESKTTAANSSKLDRAFRSSISGDGRYSVFVCSNFSAVACPGVPTDTPDVVVLRDRLTGVLTSIPRPTYEAEQTATREQRNPVISQDGCHVAFVAYDQFFQSAYVWRWTRPGCTGGGAPARLVSGTYDCSGALQPSCLYGSPVDPNQRPALSADGSVVAWVRPADQSLGTFNSTVGWVYAVRVGPNGPLEEPVAIEGVDGLLGSHIPVTGGGFPRGSIQPALSPDGRFVYYTSEFNPTTGQWNPRVGQTSFLSAQIYRYDRTLPPGVASSFAPMSGAPGQPFSFANSPAASSGVLAFAGQRAATGRYTIEQRDLATGAVTTLRADAAADFGSSTEFGEFGEGLGPDLSYLGGGVAISSDGVWVAYESMPTHSNPNPSFGGTFTSTRSESTVQVINRLSRAVQAVSVSTAGVPVVTSYLPSVSATGRYITFTNQAGGPLLVGDPVLGQSTQVYVRTRPPELTIGSVDFGPVNLLTPAPPKGVTVTNTGLSSAFVVGATSSLPAEFPLGVGDCSNRLLAPGQSCTLSIGFTAAVVGPRSTTITVSAAGAGFDFQPVAGAGSAVGTGVLVPGVVVLSLEPGAVDLGQVPVSGTSNPVPLVLRNTGTAEATIAGVLLDGPNAAEFKIVTTDCPPAPAKLAVGAACTVIVAASPVDDGVRTARLSATAVEGPVAAAALSVTGVRTPVLQVTPPVVPAGGLVTVTGQSFPRNVSVRVSLGAGTEIQAVTDANGAFTVTVLVLGGEPTGPRTVSVRDDAGRLATPVTAPLLVVSSTFRPQGSLSKPGGVAIVTRG